MINDNATLYVVSILKSDFVYHKNDIIVGNEKCKWKSLNTDM